MHAPLKSAELQTFATGKHTRTAIQNTGFPWILVNKSIYFFKNHNTKSFNSNILGRINLPWSKASNSVSTKPIVRCQTTFFRMHGSLHWAVWILQTGKMYMCQRSASVTIRNPSGEAAPLGAALPPQAYWWGRWATHLNLQITFIQIGVRHKTKKQQLLL